jgi:nucleotide-binding universal stress UspA family protein
MFRVLLPVDTGDKRALAAAETVTSLPAADSVSVTILNVQSEVDVVDEGGRVSSKEWYDESDFPPSVDKAKEYLEDSGIEVATRREHADPAEAILDLADEIDADRIVMSGQKRSPVGKALFDSVTQSVLLDSSVPVTVALR